MSVFKLSMLNTVLVEEGTPDHGEWNTAVM